MTCHSSLHISTIKNAPLSGGSRPSGKGRGGGGHLDSEIRGRPVLFWSKNKGGAGSPAPPRDPPLPLTLRLNSLPPSPRLRWLSLLWDLASHPGRLNIERTIFLLTAPEIIKKSCNFQICYGFFFFYITEYRLSPFGVVSFHCVIE